MRLQNEAERGREPVPGTNPYITNAPLPRPTAPIVKKVFRPVHTAHGTGVAKRREGAGAKNRCSWFQVAVGL